MNTLLPLPKNEAILASDLECLNTLPPLNIFRMITHMPNMLPNFIQLPTALYHGKLSTRLREIAICRHAYIANSEYELHQHILIAKANGVTDEEIQTITHDASVTSLDDEANLICLVADELETTATLSDETRTQLIQHFSHSLSVEIILCISFYSCVARFLNATQTPIEAENILAGQADPTMK